MKISWNKLLCDETLAAKEKTPSSWVDYPMDPFEQDYREIVNSVSFRHLQDKAQVFYMSKGDFVRTRLTHSLEVSTVAKQLGIMLIYNEKWNKVEAFRDLTVDQARTVPTVLACAGLLHDMGNPPFGHEGESTIGSWFEKHLSKNSFEFFGKPIRDVLTYEMQKDLCNYEGNAQVIRMLAKCRYPSEEQEANVTFATMSTLVKYPVSVTEMDKNSDDLRVHKFGYYLSEKELVKRIRRETGLEIEGEKHARNPLTYLLEAADDIAYVASDIEDAVAKKTISIGQLIAFMKEKIAELPEGENEMEKMRILTVEGILNNLEMRIDACKNSENDRIMAFHKWTNYLRNWLMYVTAGSFVKNWETIMDGTYREDLLEESYHKYTVQILKREMRENVYPKIRENVITASTIVDGLLNKFAEAVIYYDTERKLGFVDKTLVELIPQRLRTSYEMEKTGDQAYNLYLRFRMVTDFIASMTDGYAKDYFRTLYAI